MDDDGSGCGCLLIFVLIFTFIAGSYWQEDKDRKEAIAAGVARYTIDQRTGETQFEYIKSK